MKTKQRSDLPRELVLQAQAGDRAAFDELYRRSAAAVYRTVVSMVREENTAWDIHQNTYLLAYRNLDKLQDPEAFLPWLRRIAVNEAVKELKRVQPMTFTELAEAEEDEPQFPETRGDCQPEVELDKRESARLVREILDALPQKQRLVVGMYYYEEMSIREIAQALNVTQGTVKTQLHLGRKKVETRVRELEQEGVKLYGLQPTAFLTALLQRQELPLPGGKGGFSVPGADPAPVEGKPVTLTARAVKTGFFHTLGGKLAAGLLVAAVAAGGVLGVLYGRRGASAGKVRPEKPTLISETSLLVTPEDPEEQSPFPGAFDTMDDSILAAICNDPRPWDSGSPGVIWNEAEADSLIIYPRYAGSTVTARRIVYDADGRGSLEPTPVYSSVCREGEWISASLERPEKPCWVLTVRTPDGREASWVLARNSLYGTPAYEYLAQGQGEESSQEDRPEELCGVAGHILKHVGYGWDSGYGNIAGCLPEEESSPFYSLGKALARSIRRATQGAEESTAYLIRNDWFEGDAAAWMSRECRMQGDTCCLDAAWLSEYYMNEIYRETFVEGQGSPDLPLAETVARQAALFAEQRYVGYRGTDSFLAQEGEELHFDLYGILVYNPTLAAKTVSLTVNGEQAGTFDLTQGDFFTWIPLDYPNQPGDKPVHVEARITETWFGAPEQAILDLWPNLSGNLSGAR